MTAASAAAVLLTSSSARAGVPQLDKSTNLLYTPKKEMLSGGSAAARGIRLEKKNDNGAKEALKQGEKIQTVYPARFVTYLSRFLINFDDSAQAYWDEQTSHCPPDGAFAEFAESVEIGLADYFVGPLGSYSSLSSKDKGKGQGIIRQLANGLASRKKPVDTKLIQQEEKRRDKLAKQGILNLYTLLKARYTTKTAKIQLAILFSFITNPKLQPTAEIRSLLGEVDDASITQIEINKIFVRDEVSSRTSCKRGGGYSISDPPVITIGPPPPLGAAYKVAKAKPNMRSTSRILRINVIDGGAGYFKAPQVYVSLPPPGGTGSRQCIAQAIIDRKGRIDSILVLDPGYGYGRNKNRSPPKVIISPPEDRGGIENLGKKRRATAVAEIEYEIASIDVTESGNGYVSTEPPRVFISKPDQEPDWFVDVADISVLAEPAAKRQTFGGSVVEMKSPQGNIVYSPVVDDTESPDYALDRVIKNPLELLPSIYRPDFNGAGPFNGNYVNTLVADFPAYEKVKDNPRFRAVDPLFGAIGALPAQKSAMELKPNEYGRLALSGALCTVLVRTALNPLELIKTKLQLENDEELLTYARNKMGPSDPHGGSVSESQAHTDMVSPQITQTNLGSNVLTNTMKSDEAHASDVAVATKSTSITATSVGAKEEDTTEESAKLSPQDLIGSLIELRGFPSVFQSADITLLASIVFGSLGFGATELFRRSFTGFFFENNGAGGLRGQLVLLLAATIATIITCAAGAPFELLRVRSMGLVESQEWKLVMEGFLKEKAGNDDSGEEKKFANGIDEEEGEEMDSKEMVWKDYLPLWAGFGPTTTRELAFAIPKFLAFDIIAKAIAGVVNSQMGQGALPVQVGVGGTGLAISAFSGACAGLAGAFVSHPADLILTRLTATKSPDDDESSTDGKDESSSSAAAEAAAEPNWRDIVDELLAKEGGIANLYVGLAPRMVFFFLVIGLQFFLYDYVKNLLEVGSDDLSLVLDIFYAVRQGLT